MLIDKDLKPYAVVVWLGPGEEVVVFVKAMNKHDALLEHQRRQWEGRAMDAYRVIEPGTNKFNFITKKENVIKLKGK